MIKTFRVALMLGAVVCAAERWSDAAHANAGVEWALQLTDFAALPITGLPDGAGNNAGSLARINFLREEPSSTRRFFVNDLNDPLYILDRKTKQARKYLNFDGCRSGKG
jgi:hypothetical protein